MTLSEEMQGISFSWSLLQQPAHASAGTHATFRSLLAAIDQGWQVNEPVRLWMNSSKAACSLEFTLSHPARLHRIVLQIPALPSVLRYVEQSNWELTPGID